MGIGVKDVNQHEFINRLAAFLKRSGKMKLPDWTDIVKTGPYKELAPYSEDWFYIRAAALCRRMYMRAPLGVGTVKRVYGGNQRNGTAPSHFCKASGGVARKIFQALEGVKMVEKSTSRKGRVLTGRGRQHCDIIAAQSYRRSKGKIRKKKKFVPKKAAKGGPKAKAGKPVKK
ncbi:40S ribosomal protein S19 [Patella vulgata]|uniref:40S ribosomal protein S19 n=1 Tax=Patella vulgata TaxID=6465 RepID=UPI00218064A3|nr:40S ribosomal protein S19 [Patella vulgata]